MKDVQDYQNWIKLKEENPNRKKRVNKKFDENAYINKTRYRILLTKDEWLTVRQNILKRDHYRCKNCGDRKNLDVHHLLYFSTIPWKTPDRFLITLCRNCHEKIHSGKLKINHDNIVFGDNLMKRCFIIKLLWDNDLVLSIDLLRKEFIDEFFDDYIYQHVKILKEQGLIEIKDGNLCATQKEIRRVKMTTRWDIDEDECDDL